VYQYFNIYRQYIFNQDLNYFHEYLIQRFLKSGRQYTFNGWGEYTMIKIDNSNVTFELQTRTDLATSKNGTDIKRINATILICPCLKFKGDIRVIYLDHCVFSPTIKCVLQTIQCVNVRISKGENCKNNTNILKFQGLSFLFKTSINSGLLFRGGTRDFYLPKIVFGTS
jgi:hypothetical protein